MSLKNDIAEWIEELDALDATAVNAQQKLIVASMPMRLKLSSCVDGTTRWITAGIVINPDHTWQWADQ